MNNKSTSSKITFLIVFIAITVITFLIIKQTSGSFVLKSIPFIIIALAISVIIYRNLIVRIKQIKNNSNLEDDIANKVKNNIEKEKQSKLPTKCSYCGSIFSNAENICPNCGANKDNEDMSN